MVPGWHEDARKTSSLSFINGPHPKIRVNGMAKPVAMTRVTNAVTVWDCDIWPSLVNGV